LPRRRQNRQAWLGVGANLDLANLRNDTPDGAVCLGDFVLIDLAADRLNRILGGSSKKQSRLRFW
jgi:hypothetical protein